jgi:dolichyl-diphosphooligosaccharide--protein glycosyltransferase
VIYGPLLADLADTDSRRIMRGSQYDWYAMSETADWIRRNTPQPAGWLDVDQQPDYGVVAPWDMGHILTYVGRRPTSTNNFGDDIGVRNFLAVPEYFLADEDHASEILDRLAGRYVVAPYDTSFMDAKPGPDSMYIALYRRDGSEGRSSQADPGPRPPALQRHRLIYEFSGARPGASRKASFKVFEYVAGALIRGRAPAGAEVRAWLNVETDGAREFVYATRTLASERGRYELRVPYANEILSDTVVPDDRYVIEVEGRRGEARVDEVDVVRGRAIRGPDLHRTQSP